MTRYYSATAIQTTLSAPCGATDTTITVSATTGFPAAPFTLALDYQAASQEVVLVTGVASLNLTVTRGYDGTIPASHSAGASVVHTHTAKDFTDFQSHINGSSGVHGLAGTVVGTTDTQVLSNKDLTSGTNSFPATVVTTTGSQTLTNKTLTSPKVNALQDTSGNTAVTVTPTASAVNGVTVTNAATGGAPAVGATGSDANVSLNLTTKGSGIVEANGVAVVDLSSIQTLSNKTVSYPVQFVDQYGNTAFATSSSAGSATPVNYPTLYAATAGSAPSLAAQGADTNVNLVLSGKGTGLVWVSGGRTSNSTEDFTGAWTAWTPTFTNFTLGNGSMTAKYWRLGKTVTFRLNIRWGSTTSVGSSGMTFTLPFYPGGPAPIQDGSEQSYFCKAYSGSGTLVGAAFGNAGGAFGVQPQLYTGIGSGATVPLTNSLGFTSSANFSASGTYETA